MIDAFTNSSRAAGLLPTDSLADLIRAAVEDARRLNRGRYFPQADVWHSPSTEGTCHICVAGAAIAGRLDAPMRHYSPDDFTDDDISGALHALDNAREGRWGDAYDALAQPRRARAMWDGAEENMAMLEDGEFQGWEAFDSHLECLEQAANALDDFESGTPPLHG